MNNYLKKKRRKKNISCSFFFQFMKSKKRKLFLNNKKYDYFLKPEWTLLILLYHSQKDTLFKYIDLF